MGRENRSPHDEILTYHLGSTVRSAQPTTTLTRLQSVAKKIGITRVANVTGLDHVGIPVAVCIRPNAKHLSVSQGKGLTWELAQISAMMESIESYHAENSNPPDVISSYQTLSQYANVCDPNVFNNGFFAYQATQDIPWINAFDIINQSNIYIPHDVICLDSSRLRPHAAWFNANSNGLAAGNCDQEALLHGIYEVIERDALARFTQSCAKQIELESVTGHNKKLIHQFLSAGLEVAIWQIDAIVPVYFCLIDDALQIRNLGGFTGSGAHLSKEIALSRALLEAAQARLTYIVGTREEIFPMYYGSQQENHFCKSINKNQPKIIFGTDDYRPSSLVFDFQNMMDRLIQHHVQQVIIVKHTKPEINIPVFHVFIPGMRMEQRW